MLSSGARCTATRRDDFFESGLFDRFADRLLASDGLWRLIDEIAESPSVTAAISGQGLGFADQLGGEVRTRSRRADEWVERRLRRSHSDAPSDSGTPTGTRIERRSAGSASGVHRSRHPSDCIRR
jgi:hypothetical protein